MTTQDIDRRIEELEQELEHLGPFPTEVYTRIVGYYRSLANWNAGKREEYDHRHEYLEDSQRAAALCESTTRVAEKAKRVLLFTQPSCPNCPSMKTKTASRSIPGEEFDVSGHAGFEAAVRWSVTSTPTLILLDSKDAELARIMNAGDWYQLETWL